MKCVQYKMHHEFTKKISNKKYVLKTMLLGYSYIKLKYICDKFHYEFTTHKI